MKRILVYGMTENNGGIESYVMNYYRHINKDLLQFDFVTDHPSIAYSEEIKALGGEVYFIPSRRGNLLKHIVDFKKIIARGKYDVVYLNLLSASGVFSVFAAKLAGAKTVVHSHNDSVGNLKVHNFLRPMLNFCTDKRLSCSADAGTFMFGNKECKVINNAIDTTILKFDEDLRNSTRESFGFKENDFVVGHVGRMCYQKNSLFVIDVFSELLKINPSAKLLFVGMGEDYDAVLEKVNELNLSSSIVLAGMRSDMQAIYSAMDVFLLPSRFEGWGMVAVEAQAFGLPCVVSDRVKPEVNITGLMTYLSLDLPTSDWAKKLTDVSRPIDNVSKKIIDSNFDISTEALKLQEYFLNEI